MSESDELTQDERELKEQFIADVGYWEPGFDAVLRCDPEFFEVYREWGSYPHETDALAPEIREFVMIAAYSQTTTCRAAGIRRHVGRAFEAGAEFEEILEVLQIASVLGMHSFMIGAEILDDELGLSEDFSGEAFESFLDDFENRRGYRPEWWAPYYAPDPEFFDRYVDYSAHPWEQGVLAPKTREFLYIAIDATPAHLLEEGIDGHMQNALELGATREELVEVFELVSTLSFDTITTGIPILVDEARERDHLPDR